MTDIYNSVINDVSTYVIGIMDIISNTNPNMSTEMTKNEAKNALRNDCRTIINRYDRIKSILINKIIPYYNDLLIKDKNLSELYNMYLEKNQGLDTSIKSFYSDSLTNNRKTFYESMALETVVNWNTFFMYLYFTLLFALILGILFSPHRLSSYKSISIIIILFLYPFLVDPILQMIYNFFGKIYNLYPKNVYNKL